MSLSLILSLAIKKIKFRKARSLLLALPILLLTIIVVTVSSWAGSLEHKINQDVLTAVNQSKYIIGVDVGGSQVEDLPEYKGVFRPQTIDNKTIEKIKDIDGVTVVDQNNELWMNGQVEIEGFESHNFYTYAIQSLSSRMSDLYGVKEFEYVPGQPIPIIAGTRLLQETHFNFNGQSSIEQPVNITPDSGIQRAVESDSNRDLLNSNLIGKPGLLKLHYLPQDPKVLVEQTGMNATYTRISKDQLSKYQAEYQKILQPYWNLDQLSKPITLEFKIVGINTSSDLYSGSSYIPLEAIIAIKQALHEGQQQARTSTPIPAELLQEKIVGDLINRGGVYQSRPNFNIQVSKATLEKPQIQIPGLLSKPTKDTDGKLRFEEVSDYNFNNQSLAGGYTTVRIADFDSRQDIVKQIMAIDEGKIYAGFSDVDGYSQLLEIMSKALLIASAILSLIVAIIVLILAWGFASDANREVGLLRALGITAKNARQVVLWQLIVIFSISLLSGFILSIAVLYGGANWIADWLNTTYFSHSQAAYAGRNVLMQASEMQLINLRYVAPYLVATMALPVLAAYLATRRNLKTDPLQALKM